jgi:MFS family permease
MLFVFYFHYAIAITPLLYAYPTEIFPYELRGWGVAITLVIANTTLLIGQVANPVAMGRLGWRYYILFCVLDALFFVCVWFLYPETKGKSLEEVAEVFGDAMVSPLTDVDKLEHVASHEEHGSGGVKQRVVGDAKKY